YRKLATIPSFKESIVEQILEDHYGNVWIAAHDGHVFRFSPGGREIRHFNFSEMFAESDKNLTTNAILEDVEGSMWVGTSRGLLEILNPAVHEAPAYRLLQNNPENPQSLSWNWVLCLYQDPAVPHLLWIGTRGGGLNCYDKKTGLFCHYSEVNGLADNVVYGIVPDDEGNLWCSTNRGLSRFTPQTRVFVNYYESDGLQNSEFNTGAAQRSTDGSFLFGGVNGLTVFDPKAIKLSSEPPPVAITSIRVRGNLLRPAREGSPLQFAPYFEQTLTLPFSENNITFEFAALDFANPATNRYRYQMKGIDRDWIEAGATHSANYASLPPGTYVFQVQAATADGPWNPQGATFHLVILPPLYRSWAAYLFYIMLIAGAAWSFIRFREERLREHHVLQLEQQESERLKELDSFKNRFFANITHEFRTPLTIILGLAERLKRGETNDSVQGSAGNIMAQSNNLLDLVNQMLDLAKLESHGLTLHPVQGNLNAFTRSHVESFYPLAAYKDLQLNLETEQPDLVLDFDPQHFRQILNNLISNAIRHTPSGGNITVRLFGNTERQAVLVISDTGVGILPEDLPHIFDRFFQGSVYRQNQSTGGIGLALTRELVLLAGGDIQVSSEPGNGATFTVTLPITNTAAPVADESLAALPLSAMLLGTEASTPTGPLPLLLVIEDNSEVADYLRLCLNGHYHLLFAADGSKGIQMAFEHIPDLIISDIMMPEKDGLEVTDILKNDERTSHIPIVLLSAKTQLGDRLEGLRRGANAYLSKPFNERELLLILNNQLAFQKNWKQRYAALEKGLPAETVAASTSAVPNDAFQAEDEFIKKLFGIFETHYPDEHFNLDQLCRLIGMSSSQLHRKLSALTDQPAMQMLRTFRLNKARELLLTRRELHVAEVCMQVGFSNPAHFSRMFSKTFGMAPSAVRNES
ncbi:MAG: helix-turn-helix domain-containing protein, partial [Saprospiraceae bacterium]|nr:helix-turn-helix domain-containing protein [Saprospiraceae bacterium]